MLFVFQMDIGQMLTFDMSLLMDDVSRLQIDIAKTTGIPVEKQILLVSGGHSLKPDQKLVTYGAGADTNPVFLFSKTAIESQEPPLVRSFGVSKDMLSILRDRVTEALSMQPSYETVVTRAKLAMQIGESANKILSFCNNEFREQHLQYQGWGAVVANLEELSQALQKTEIKFSTAFHVFLPTREKQFDMLNNLEESLELLDRVPILEALKVEELHSSVSSSFSRSRLGERLESRPMSLLFWISTQGQGQSVEGLRQKCLEDISHFNKETFETCDKQVQDLLSMISKDPHQMKELVGIERRLSELEKRLNETKKIAKAQHDMAQGIMNHQQRLTKVTDMASILPELCESHKQQLRQMLDSQQRIMSLQTNFRNSKQEMSTNIHQRLGWVMHVETQISKLNSELIFHMKTLKMLEYNLDVLSQVKEAPKVYADMVVETTRRRLFSQTFSQWAEHLVEDSSNLYKIETERRKQFAVRMGEHFLVHTLFKGFEDMPPNFATKVPRSFDDSLPEITTDDISLLRSSVPELEDLLSVPVEPEEFSQSLYRPIPHLSTLSTDISPKYWNKEVPVQPSVVKATEAPATTFTLPELQESRATEYLPALSSLTDTMRDVMSSEVQVDCQNLEASITVLASQDALTAKSSIGQNSAVTVESISEPSASVSAKEVHGKMNTDSTSPPSSMEFATADFYFEDSMPSPMADSPSEKKEKKEEVGMNISSMTCDVVSMRTQLEEKERLIHELRLLMKEKDEQLYQKQQIIPSSLFTVLEVSKESDSVMANSEKEVSEVQSSHSANEKLKTADLKRSDSFGKVDHRVRDLEQKLKVLTESQLEAEKKLQRVQEQEIASSLEKDTKIQQLEAKLEHFDATVSAAKIEIAKKEEEVKNLEAALSVSKTKAEEFQQKFNKGEMALRKVRETLAEHRDILKGNIPSLRESLLHLRTSVFDNRSQVESFVSSSKSAVELQIATFNSHILADISVGHEKEKEAQKSEIERLKNELDKVQQDASSKLAASKVCNEELTQRNAQIQLDFDKKSSEREKEFDIALKDAETKHALEMEIELDKCRSESQLLLDEAERNIESLNQMKDKMALELEELKETFKMERLEIERRMNEEMEALEKRKDMELEILKASLTSALEERSRQGDVEMEELKDQFKTMQEDLVKQRQEELEALRVELTNDHEWARTQELATLKENLSNEHETLRAQEVEVLREELTQKHEASTEQQLVALRKELLEEHEATMGQSLSALKEELTRDHQSSKEKELACLKEDLEGRHSEEKEQELAALKQLTTEQGAMVHDLQQMVDEQKKAMADVLEQKQLDYANKLTELKTQFDLERESLQAELSKYQKQALTHSETQTELLAEVISLTSSVSDGSEEMNRQPLSLGDEKDEAQTMAQERLEDGNFNISQDETNEQKEEIRTLKEENRKLCAKLLQAEEEKREAIQQLEKKLVPVETESASAFASSMTSSFILMDKDQYPSIETDTLKLKDQKINQLEKKLMEISMTASLREVTTDKVSIKGCEKGDLVLLCLDERHDQYVVFTVGTNLHFLHSESLEALGLRPGGDPPNRKSWILAEVVDKEYCLAKKPNNRFRVPQGTCFYRVKCRPWKTDLEMTKFDRDGAKHVKSSKPEHGGAKPKKSDKK